MVTTKQQLNKYNQCIIHNFEVSIVMPFYKKLSEFTRVLPLNAHYFQRNGIEVILVMDESSEEEGVIRLVKDFPFINWKVIVNDKKHDPRNPVKVLNVGIRHATKKYIMVSSPETLFYSDVIFQLRSILENYPEHYAIGTVAFIQEGMAITSEAVKNLEFIPYGSFMTNRSYLEKITGYDESFKNWGGDDDNIRKRLDLEGIRKLYVPESKSLHFEKQLKIAQRRMMSKSLTAMELRKIHCPKIAKANGNEWGRDFNRLAYDWRNNQYSKELCYNYLKQFTKFKIKDNSIFDNKYNKIILCQSFNETENLNEFLEDMAKYFDGIILLDDDSSDGTYESAIHEKLLVKICKKRDGFNDLLNRSILLKLASFFKTEWLCFMDFDERFDERFVDFDSITNSKNVDAVNFRLIHLWNDHQHYNASYPCSHGGICDKTSMFRNLGCYQINTLKKRFHFTASPVKRNVLTSQILVKHLGNLTLEKRIKKYTLYKAEDTLNDQSSYEHLLNVNPLLKNVSDISLELLTCYPKQ